MGCDGTGHGRRTRRGGTGRDRATRGVVRWCELQWVEIGLDGMGRSGMVVRSSRRRERGDTFRGEGAAAHLIPV